MHVMNLRQQQAEHARATILDAAQILIFSDSDPKAFTMQAVADAAGVSHRTLYRYFETRAELIEELGTRMDQRVNAESGHQEPTDFEEWVGNVEGQMAFGAANREMLRRAAVLGITTGEFRRGRDDLYWHLFRERFPNLDDNTAREDFAAVRHLFGAVNVVLMGERFELSPEDLVRGIGRAVAALVADIEARDQEAQSG